MKTSRAWLCTLLLAATAPAAEWQVVLLKPPDCNACSYAEESLKRSAQLREAVLDDGRSGQVVARIVRRTSAELSAQEWSELRALPRFDELIWRQRMAARSALVLLKRDGTIVAAGDIADSADLRQARFPDELNMPDVGRDPLEVRSARAALTGDLFLRAWNLDWFYRQAQDPGEAARRAAAWATADAGTLSPPLAGANVLLASTASGAVDNEIFNALRIEEIRDALVGTLGVDPQRLRIFYGGEGAHGANALEVRGGRLSLVRRDVADAQPFSPESVQRIFRSIRERPGSRNLLVLVGHGSPEGAGMWGSPVPLPPAALRAMHEASGGDNVLVSGNCFGGVMARAMSCGFFGARPDIVATGCQADAAEVAQSRDYLHMFFLGIAPGARRAVDADGNGSVSFDEAHWYASIEGDARNVTYTSIDALADSWFHARPGDLPASMRVDEVLQLTASATPAEARALRTLLAGYAGDLALPLDDLAGQAARWTPATGLPRVLAAQLARRLLYRRLASGADSGLQPLQACESRDIAAFLRP